MASELAQLLGIRLDDVAKLPLVVALKEPGQAKMVHDRLYLEYTASGIAFDADLDGKVATVFLYGEGYQHHRAFRGDLPEGISFGDDPRAVRSRLGKPSASGGGALVQFLGKVPKWDRFDRPDHSLHIQYADDEDSIDLVSLMRPDSVPK